jgi:hypothetical protein
MSERFIDPVVAEVHAARAAMLEEAGGDVRVMMQRVIERQKQSDRPVVTQPLPRLAPGGLEKDAAKPTV